MADNITKVSQSIQSTISLKFFFSLISMYEICNREDNILMKKVMLLNMGPVKPLGLV